MRIMIVEDQQIILAGIKKMILDELPCDIVTISSGEEALDWIRTLPAPDVILSDIVMPGMDGLRFIEQAKELLPFCQFLIISGYDRFSFAQKAIQLGVADYFLKPIKRRRLLDTLKGISLRHEERRKKACAAWLDDLLRCQSSDHDIQPYHIEKIREVKGLVAAFYCVRGEAPSLHDILPGCYLMGATPDMTLYLLLLPETRFDDVHRDFLSRAKEASWGIDRAGSISRAFQQCAEADDNRFFANAVSTGFSCENEMQRLEEALVLQEGREKAVAVALHVLFHTLEQADGPARSVRGTVEMLMDKLLGRENDFHVDRYWQSASSYSEFLTVVRWRLAEWIGAPRKETMADRIKCYVDTHCTQPLNVKRVSRAVALSPNYASSLFKQETGESLSAYIRQRQLEAARHLLLTTDMRVYEIAEQLGYSDEKYFSSMFRMYYHVSPKAIRRTDHGSASYEE